MKKVLKTLTPIFSKLPKNIFKYLPISAISQSTLTYSPLSSFSTFNFSTQKQHYHLTSKSSRQGQGYYMEQMLVACLSLYTYYIQSNGQAIIIDPINDIQDYVKILKQRNSKLKYVALTHFHADYVAGHNQLKKLYPYCDILMGPRSNVANYKVITLENDTYIQLGNSKLRVLHTPGHTQQSTCYLLYDKNNNPTDMFSGDTLFLGQVGRPDLAVKSNLTSKDLAFMLFESIQKLKNLDDNIRIYPGHGAGSACGKNIGKGDFCTLGTQKQNNYALKINQKQNFANEILKDMPAPPNYFFNVVKKNKQQPFEFQQIYTKSKNKLNIETFLSQAKKSETQLIDIRSTTKQFIQGTIKNAYCIGYKGKFADFTGLLLNPHKNILLYGSENDCLQCIKRLIRIGFTNIIGYNGFNLNDVPAQYRVTYKIASTNHLLQIQNKKSNKVILDLRNKGELESNGIFEGSNVHIPIGKLQQNISSLDKNANYVAHCASGYRSKIAAQILAKYNLSFEILPQSFDHYRVEGAKVIKKH